MTFNRHIIYRSKSILKYTKNSTICQHFSTNQSKFMPQLQEVVTKLNDFANEKFAEKWDNVGLLIEPYTPRDIKKIFVTNDLTNNVMAEAILNNSDLIISYHPPIFAPLKRITQKSWKESIISMCLENRIALYSPHTAWDSIPGGINDWLLRCLPISDSEPITKNVENPQIGAGRLCKLKDHLSLDEVIERFKSHLKVETLHISKAVGKNDLITSIAVCAGSGASVLKDVKADLYFTGEMSHHEVLDAVHNGSHVILSNHSNSERGFLIEFKKRFETLLENKVEIIVSKEDKDPLKSLISNQN